MSLLTLNVADKGSPFKHAYKTLFLFHSPMKFPHSMFNSQAAELMHEQDLEIGHYGAFYAVDEIFYDCGTVLHLACLSFWDDESPLLLPYNQKHNLEGLPSHQH